DPPLHPLRRTSREPRSQRRPPRPRRHRPAPMRHLRRRPAGRVTRRARGTGPHRRPRKTHARSPTPSGGHPVTAQCGCGAPTGDGTTLCRACTTRLAADLDQVTWLERELDTVLARQAVYGDRAGGRSAEHPLPYDPRASEAAWVLRDTLTNVARALGPEPPANRPESAGDATKPSGWTDPLGTGVSAARIARSLAQRLDTIRRHPEAYLL